jgi:ATP-binding cassette subfamily B multidrug efflux pump
MPVMMFVGNLTYVAIAVVGGLRVASGQISLGDVQAFIQYSRQFTQPLTQVASMANLLQSGVASAERVFEVLDAEEQEADGIPGRRSTRATGRGAFEDVSFSVRRRISRSSSTSTSSSSPVTRSRSSGRPAPARRRWSTW